jgi:hypothetical protein
MRTNGAALNTEAKEDIKLFGSNTGFDPDALVKLGVEAIYRSPEDYMATTGLVIAGYGDDDFFPSYLEYTCPGFIGSRLFHARKTGNAIDVDDSGHFNAFGTTAMVDTFTLGFGPDVYSSVRKSLAVELNGLATKIEAETGVAASNVATYISDAIKNHTDKWVEEVVENHARPLRRVICSLPVEEMAGLAETLVMLESLKERVTRPSESVSGPIDVAVITKHEGFIWTKRKHFFDPKLNARFFSRLQNEYASLLEDGDDESTH